MNLLEDEKLNKILLGVIIILQIITISIVVICSDCYKNDNQKEKVEEIALVEDKEIEKEEDIEVVVQNVRVDLKGAVKKPGVYEVDSNSRIYDVIELAGGLKNNASTSYLNLSKKVTDEMIINVYTTNQVKNMNVKEEIKQECICPSIDISECLPATVIVPDNQNTSNANEQNGVNNNKISINNASKEQLMTLDGIGESKALAIIDYRNKNNGFKSIEDLLLVSGIGDAMYNKIKDYITL